MASQGGALGEAAGAIMGSIGALASGGAEASAHQYNSEVARQQAAEALQQSYIKGGLQERAAIRTGGEATAGYAAGGVAPTTGSALYVMNDIAAQGEMAKQLELYQGRVQATGYMRQSDIEHKEATAARTASYIKATGTLLGAGGDIAGKQFSGSGSGSGGGGGGFTPSDAPFTAGSIF